MFMLESSDGVLSCFSSVLLFAETPYLPRVPQRVLEETVPHPLAEAIDPYRLTTVL
jgi:hypothetical protein